MSDTTFAEVLGTYLAQRQYTPRRLAETTQIPEDTIKGWLSGRGKTIREWNRAVIIAAALGLDLAETRHLFQVAKAPVVALDESTIMRAQATIRNEQIQELITQWYRELAAERRNSPAPAASAEAALPPDQPPAPDSALAPEDSQPGPATGSSVRRALPGRIGLTAAGIIALAMLLWTVFIPDAKPQAPGLAAQPEDNGLVASRWDTFDDHDAGGISSVAKTPVRCLEPVAIAEARPLPGCIAITGAIPQADGYLGAYMIIRPDDISGKSALVFKARGRGDGWHVSLEITQPDGQHFSYHAPFTPTDTIEEFNIRLDQFDPFEDAPPMDLTKITTLALGISGGPQKDVEMWIDQAALLP